VRRALLVTLLASVVGVSAASASILPGFKSPSGNISCFLVPGHPSVLRCSIAHSAYAQALQAQCIKPDGSGVDWHGFELPGTGKGAVTCTGGILYNPAKQHPRYVTLAYGHTWRVGVFTCASKVSGVTCRNRLGHGLSISRLSWRAW
jgi:hypothetical protein